MDNKIKNRYTDGSEEVFQFKQVSHNSDELLSVFEEEPVQVMPNIQNTANYERNMNKYRSMQGDQYAIFLRDRQETAVRQRNNISSKSIGNTKRTEQRYRKKKSNVIIARKQREVASILCAIALFTGLTVGGIKTVQNVGDFVQRQVNVQRGSDVLRNEALYRLFINDLAKVDGRGNYEIKENTITDYRRLEATSDLDVYIFKQILPAEEFNKFIKSVSYNNGIHYYTDMTQFLNINGYYTEGTNSPSLVVFYNMMEDIINNKADKLVDNDNINNRLEEVQSHRRGGI